MRRFVISITLLLMAAGVLTGCTASREEKKIEKAKYHVYYINSEETGLKQEIYKPENEDPQVMLTELMQLLKAEGGEDGSQSLLPAEVEVNTYTIHDKTLTIDFNKVYNDMSATREVLTRAGVVRMLVQLPNIEYVKISVDGEELVDSQGMKLSIMNADTFVEYSGEDINSYQYATITLYFTNEKGDALLPEERTVYYNSNVPLERVVVEQIMKGPEQEGLYPTLPSGINIMGVTTDRTNCYLNLDSVFISDALGIQEDIPIYSIVNSLADACQVKNVQISVNGESNMVFRESIQLNQFFKKREDLIEKQE